MNHSHIGIMHFESLAQQRNNLKLVRTIAPTCEREWDEGPLRGKLLEGRFWPVAAFGVGATKADLGL